MIGCNGGLVAYQGKGISTSSEHCKQLLMLMSASYQREHKAGLFLLLNLDRFGGKNDHLCSISFRD
jgi:hypothetical protein